MFKDKKALLLDMNSTFMFGEDRFGTHEDYSVEYNKCGGKLSSDQVNDIITATYNYLDVRYPDAFYRHQFPSLQSAIRSVTKNELPNNEVQNLVETFSRHEMGVVPSEYVTALYTLKEHFVLSTVIDIWSPKDAWLMQFKSLGIDRLFSAYSFSSDHGMVKPSPQPFEYVVEQLGITTAQSLVIGDSVRRDLGGATAAGIDCVLVGGAEHPDAIGSFKNLLEFTQTIVQTR